MIRNLILWLMTLCYSEQNLWRIRRKRQGHNEEKARSAAERAREAWHAARDVQRREQHEHLVNYSSGTSLIIIDEVLRDASSTSTCGEATST